MQSVPLERFQADFAAALDGADVAPELSAAIAGSSVPSWLTLYRRNIQAAGERALAAAFPVVRALVGDECFSAMARAYGHTHASRSGDLRQCGEQFAAFCRAFEHARALPYLGDVAALELLVRDAHYAADVQPLPRERAAAMAPEELLASRFDLHPACAWIESRFPIATIWRAHAPGSHVALPDSLDRHERVLIARPHWHIEVVASNAAEIAALTTLRGGGAMDHAIGAALAHDEAFDFARTFVRWLDLGVLVAAAL